MVQELKTVMPVGGATVDEDKLLAPVRDELKQAYQAFLTVKANNGEMRQELNALREELKDLRAAVGTQETLRPLVLIAGKPAQESGARDSRGC
jgi:hypothetical protein